MKWIGMLAIILSCTLYGIKLSNEKTERIRTLFKLDGMLNVFIQAISCTMMPIPDALMCAAQKDTSCVFFMAAVKMKEGCAPFDAFYDTVRCERALTDTDIDIILTFAKGLSSDNKEGQISNAKLCISRLHTAQDEAKGEADKSCKLYKSAGVLVGTLIALLLS